MSHCDASDYGFYTNVEEAKEACRKDSNCAAIYDHSCDDHGSSLCPLGYTEEKSSSSCIYIKLAGTVIIKIIKMNILQRYGTDSYTMSSFIQIMFIHRLDLHKCNFSAFRNVFQENTYPLFGFGIYFRRSVSLFINGLYVITLFVRQVALPRNNIRI